MRGYRVVEVVGGFDCGLSIVHICADPEIGAGLELSEQGVLIDDIAA